MNTENTTDTYSYGTLVEKEVFEKKLAVKKIEEELGFGFSRLPQNRHVLIMPHSRYNKGEDAKASKDSLIIIPATKTKYDQFSTCVGKVLSMAEDCYTGETWVGRQPSCKIGDWVIFQRGAGSNIFKYKGVSMLFIFDDKVRMPIDDPEDIQFSDE